MFLYSYLPSLIDKTYWILGISSDYSTKEYMLSVKNFHFWEISLNQNQELLTWDAHSLAKKIWVPLLASLG